MPSTVDGGATAWVLASAALVLLMTPGVAFFYGGMVGRTLQRADADRLAAITSAIISLANGAGRVYDMGTPSRVAPPRLPWTSGASPSTRRSSCYLFGTPGQDRFGFMWNDLIAGALGALVIVDTRRLDDCYAAVDYFEQAKVPFVVAVNRFDGQVAHNMDDARLLTVLHRALYDTRANAVA